MKYKIQTTALLILLTIVAAACDTFKDEMTSSDAYVIGEKDLSGTWQLYTVTRNGTDISSAMDFTDFHLVLNENQTYTIENYLPFIVDTGGYWYVDDPEYPFFLSFIEEGSSTLVEIEITYPVVNGERNIQLSISPGCYSNTYVYTFERVD